MTVEVEVTQEIPVTVEVEITRQVPIDISMGDLGDAFGTLNIDDRELLYVDEICEQVGDGEFSAVALYWMVIIRDGWFNDPDERTQDFVDVTHHMINRELCDYLNRRRKTH